MDKKRTQNPQKFESPYQLPTIHYLSWITKCHMIKGLMYSYMYYMQVAPWIPNKQSQSN